MKNLKNILKILILLLITLSRVTAQDNLLFVDSIQVSGDYFAVDALQNIYVVNNQKIYKYSYTNFHWKKNTTYSNNSAGNISDIDISDPFSILIFYAGLNQIQFLDKELSPIQKAIQLDELGHSMVDEVCISHQGGFWLFDSQKQQLFYYNQHLQNEYKSKILSSYIPQNSETGKINELNHKVFLPVINKKLLVFDQFGTILNEFRLNLAKNHQIKKDEVVFSDTTKSYLQAFSFTTSVNKKIYLPENFQAQQFKIQQNKLYLFDGETIKIYTLLKR